MTTIYNIERTKTGENNDYVLIELRGLSTDTKPTALSDGKLVDNGSVFIEIDTGKLFFYDLENQEWKGE